jgi:hypothetical protein
VKYRVGSHLQTVPKVTKLKVEFMFIIHTVTRPIEMSTGNGSGYGYIEQTCIFYF